MKSAQIKTIDIGQNEILESSFKNVRSHLELEFFLDHKQKPPEKGPVQPCGKQWYLSVLSIQIIDAVLENQTHKDVVQESREEKQKEQFEELKCLCCGIEESPNSLRLISEWSKANQECEDDAGEDDLATKDANQSLLGERETDEEGSLEEREEVVSEVRNEGGTIWEREGFSDENWNPEKSCIESENFEPEALKIGEEKVRIAREFDAMKGVCEEGSLMTKEDLEDGSTDEENGP